MKIRPELVSMSLSFVVVFILLPRIGMEFPEMLVECLFCTVVQSAEMKTATASYSVFSSPSFLSP